MTGVGDGAASGMARRGDRAPPAASIPASPERSRASALARGGRRLASLAWVTLPALLLVVLALSVVKIPGSYGSPRLLVALDFTFYTLGAGLIAYLLGRSFLARGAPEILMMACGVVVWGATAAASIAAGSRDPNLNVTTYDLGALVAALCHASAAWLASRPRRPLHATHLLLGATYAAAIGAVALVALVAVEGWIPVFFVHDRGGTPLRQVVLGSAAAIVAFAAARLHAASRSPASSFRRWYALALGLFAVGFLAFLLEPTFGGAVGWTGRVTQYLAGAFMIVAAAASLREARAWGVPLEAALRETEERYRALFENMTEGFFLAEVITDAAGKPVDYRFLEVNPAFEPLTGVGRRVAIGRTARELFPNIGDRWIETFGRVALTRAPARIEDVSGLSGRCYAASAYSPAPGVFACLFSEVTERRRADEAVRRSEEAARRRALELETVLDAVPALVLISRERDARTMEPNRYGAELLRVPSGANVSKRAPDGGQARHYRLMRNGAEIPYDELPVQLAARGHEVRGYEFDLVFEDGETHRLFGNAKPLCVTGGAPAGGVGAFLDITNRKRAEDALRQADRLKDEFLGMLSHELRNPLAPIRNSVYILEHAAPGGPQAARAHAVIRRQTEHLTRLVDDLLDVTRIARGKIELRRAPADLCEVVGRTAEDFRAVMEERGIAFRVAVPEAPLRADADATRVGQVVGNLLHNAAKFTRRGDAVTLTLRRDGTDAEIRVRDTGIGIEPALLADVFQPFVQADRSLARTEGGLGLGLALVRAIAELHGGSVRAESAGKGRGAEFVVRLPLGRPAADREPQGAEREGSPRRRRVLVVEDSADAAESLAQLVEILGHVADVAHDGPAALEKARANPPDVVLCDLGLPGMSGYEVAKALRARYADRVQLVAVSGSARPEDVKAAAEAGFDRHVAKPSSPEEIGRLLA